MAQDNESTTKEAAQKEISSLVSQAYDLIRKAETIADEHKLSFGFDVAYGMGGTYIGDPEKRYSDYSEDGWHASSHSC